LVNVENKACVLSVGKYPLTLIGKARAFLRVLISILTSKAVGLFPPAPRYVDHLLYVLFTLFVSRVCLLGCLEAEDLVLELADGPGLGEAERLGGLLHGTDHGRRATDEDLDVGSRGREALL
jgi:hypothetical protein